MTEPARTIKVTKDEFEKLVDGIVDKSFERLKDTPTKGKTPLPFGGLEEEADTSSGPCIDKSYKGMFYPNQDNYSFSNGGWKSPDEYFSVVARGQYDARLIPTSQVKGFNEGDATAGGYLVPEQQTAMIVDASLESEVVRPRATVWTMTSNIRSVPLWDNLNHSSSLYGGMNMVFLDEGATASNQEGKIKKMSLKAKKAGIYTKASSELLEDGADFQAQLGTALANSLSWGFDYYCFSGNGAGQGLGIFNSPCLITVEKEAGQAPNTLVWENLTKILARLNPASFSRSVWVANQTCIPDLLSLTIDVGTAGSYVPVLQESGGQFTILTRPVIFTEKVPALGSANCIGLFDFSQYIIGMRREMALEKSNAPGWFEDEISFRMLLRWDCQPAWDTVLTPKNGDTLSPFVVLEATA